MPVVVYRCDGIDGDHARLVQVDGADRRRIDDGTGEPQLRDGEWHRVRVERDGSTGRIEVYLDDSATPGLRATDTTIAAGAGGTSGAPCSTARA